MSPYWLNLRSQIWKMARTSTSTIPRSGAEDMLPRRRLAVMKILGQRGIQSMAGGARVL